MVEHPGIEKTKELVLRDYWWPKLKKDVKTYIKGCETCARTKANTQAKHAPLHPNEIPSEPWTHISINIVTGLPFSNGYDAILVIINCFSKVIIPIACNSELSSEGWAKILRDEVYAKYSMPTTVISDCGPQFVSKFLKDLYTMLQIKGNVSTTFHPQTDGQTNLQTETSTWRIYPVFNETLLHPYTPPVFPNQEHPPPPPPDIVDSNEQYEVKAILDDKHAKFEKGKANH
ncbi:uncharacterized protein ARMOST_03428 [Armillaria ostoyae]|uniref:Integrase catalytic domain-containing protein n=1 Tax=Armillaria ostoyae TaxID=47428 RepID=A0A284QUH6_ARMOS|nr:uncharacterized protein ARMOST_03428 [Armillaria ostoyae]